MTYVATVRNFLVTCVQPETLHISLHYDELHLPIEYLTLLRIRLQIRNKLLIPIDALNWSGTLGVERGGETNTFTETGKFDSWFDNLSFSDL